ncbi:unnamed protein product [Owenia fusiformis]|uniref:Uncharacterized protein n=1 Tax=Owenia fusiformis TaxID=6347 RepID=A0A8J1TY43_OWEFU|nr:unnamed protein product [Owenia fusiformis]
MSLSTSQSFLNLFIFCVFLATTRADQPETGESNVQVVNFDVKPGGHTQSFDQTVGDFNCKFTYACQGGTKEEWVFAISHDDDESHWSCSVERPGGTSYLFFEHFKLEISGANIHGVEAYGKEDTPLEPNEFKINKKKNLVKEKADKFKSQLAHLKAFAHRGKQEL